MSNPRQIIHEALVEHFQSTFPSATVDTRMTDYDEDKGELAFGAININIMSERLKDYVSMTPEIQRREAQLCIFIFIVDSDKARSEIDQMAFDLENAMPQSLEGGYQSYELESITFGKIREGESPIRLAKLIFNLLYEFTPTPNVSEYDLNDLDRIQVTNDIDNMVDRVGDWS
jgi:hypothetical protein